jgi:hypothetical protein
MLTDALLKLHAKIMAGPVSGKLEYTEVGSSPYVKPIEKAHRTNGRELDVSRGYAGREIADDIAHSLPGGPAL